MSKVLFLILTIVSIFISPLFNLASAAEPCKQTATATGKNIDYYPVDSSGNRLNHIEEGVPEIKIRFDNIGPGWYRLQIPKAGPPAESDKQEAKNGTVTLTITDGDKRNNGTHVGNLQYSPDNNWGTALGPIILPALPGIFGRGYNEQYCREVSYTVGYPKEFCSAKVIPATPSDKQKFIVEVINAPAGDFRITHHDRSIVGSLVPKQIGDITIDTKGRGVSNLIGPMNSGKYSLDLDKSTGITVMCSKELEVIVASEPAPSCALITSGTNYMVKAFNLKPSTNYEIHLEENNVPSRSPISTQNSGGSMGLQAPLKSAPAPGTYKGIVKDVNNNGCDVAFTIDSDGKLIPGLVITGRRCDPSKDPTCTSAGVKSCGPNGGVPTAIGCIPTEPKEITSAVLGFITGIAGGIAFLLMLAGAFQMMTSAGNPDTLNAGRQRFTNAIIGLLFVIFAVLLMQIIGVDILKLPGFNK